jgi:hypothetical protein
MGRFVEFIFPLKNFALYLPPENKKRIKYIDEASKETILFRCVFAFCGVVCPRGSRGDTCAAPAACGGVVCYAC